MTDRFVLEVATAADLECLVAIGRDTFTEKFAHLYTAEDLETFLAAAHSREWYDAAIADPSVGVWLIRDKEADEGANVAAYGVCGPNALPIKRPTPKAAEIKRVYVRDAYQNKRLGRRLMDVMLDWLDEMGLHPVYVGVYSDNRSAQRFYGAYGFVKVGEYEFLVGRHRDREFILSTPNPKRLAS